MKFYRKLMKYLGFKSYCCYAPIEWNGYRDACIKCGKRA